MSPTPLPLLMLFALLGACGGGSASPSTPAPAEAAGTAQSAPGAPAAATSASPTAAPAEVLSLTAKPDVKPDAPPPAAEEGAPPPVSTELKGFVTRQLLGTNVVFITVASAGESCASVTGKAPPAKGAQRVELRAQWEPGYYDFSNRMAEGKLAVYQGASWSKVAATQGGVQVRAAPTAQGGTGRIHVKATRPGSSQSLDAEIDVTVCAALDFSKKGKK